MAGRIAGSGLAAAVVAAAVGAGALAGAIPDRALAGPAREQPPLALKERLRQRLSLRGKAPLPSYAFSEDRRLRLRADLPMEEDAAGALSEESRVGIRLGGLTVERSLGEDRRWRPGRRKATFRIPAGAPEDSGVVVLKARWGKGRLRVSLRGRGLAPLAGDLLEDPAGDREVPFDAAARLGALSWRLDGTAAASVARSPVPVPDGPSDLVRVDLAGEGRILADSEDVTAPVIVLDAPLEGIVPEAGVVLTGSVRDDRSLVRMTWSVDGGAENGLPFTADPESGFLGDRTAVVSVPVVIPPGWAVLTVRAYDAAGNVGAVDRSLLVTVPRLLSLGAGNGGVLANRNDGSAAGWGTPAWTFGSAATPLLEPTTIAGINGARDYAVGEGFSLALLGDGTVAAWGSNHRGQLGDGTFDSRPTPAPVEGLDGVVGIAAGQEFAVALRADGTVWTWGSGAFGQLGDGKGYVPGEEYRRSLPALVDGLPPVRQVAAFGTAGYALDDEGRTWEWGSRTAGAQADGVPSPETFLVAPRRLDAVPAAARIAAGSAMIAGIVPGGTLFAYGADPFGAGLLGGAGEGTDWMVPGVTDAAEVACGWAHVLVRRTDRTVAGFGGNWSGQIGDGTTDDRGAPAPIPGLVGVLQIAASHSNGYAVLEDGSVRAWGWNGQGQVGDGTTDTRTSPTPVVLDP